nr:polyprenyl synthetase family protein [Agromyces seonyuensis]
MAPLDAISRRFLSGGKRFRARFCDAGWRAFAPTTAENAPAVTAGAALELFHAAALVHDDLIDNSDTRRGAPAAHRRFEALHAESGWAGDADAFGRSSAILLGDLLLGWSDELFDEGLAGLPRAGARAARDEFQRMRTEVTAGQYLDIFEEHAWLAYPEADARRRAELVVVYKSAKYSIEAPLAIGAAMAGADAAGIESLRAFALPLGIAYQLRDDLLGVFGDPAVTGKPAGDDLREGKRTMLIAMVRERLEASAREVLDARLGDPTLDAHDVAELQSALRETGAVDELEAVITARTAEARTALAAAPIAEDARESLTELTEAVTRRAA